MAKPMLFFPGSISMPEVFAREWRKTVFLQVPEQ